MVAFKLQMLFISLLFIVLVHSSTLESSFEQLKETVIRRSSEMDTNVL